MSLNPLRFTEQVLGDFLRYQLTAYPLADERLREQMRARLEVGQARRSPLIRGPYVSLSRAFTSGARVEDLTREGILHPHLANLVLYPELFGHQEAAVRAIAARKNTLVSTGTGSGKTECFLYPIISRCLELRDQNVPAGIVAVLVYPMNALAEDQMLRLRGLLAGTGISFGLYVGSTPRRHGDVTGERLGPGASHADYRAALERLEAEGRNVQVHPQEERPSREEMRSAPPRVLLTNVKQLELLLTRAADVELFDGARLEFVVFDEAHTWGGAEGAEAASLVRRLRAFCGRGAAETVCIGTSATLADPTHGLEPAVEFASRFFGVPRDSVEIVTERYRVDDWSADRTWPPAPPRSAADHLSEVLAAVDEGPEAGARIAAAYRSLTGSSLGDGDWRETLYDRLSADQMCFAAAEALSKPVALDRLTSMLGDQAQRTVSEEEILCWLLLGAASRKEGRPLMRPVVHVFVRGMGGMAVSFEPGGEGPRLVTADAPAQGADERCRLPLLSCTTCGQHYFVHHLADLRVTVKGLDGGEAVGDRRVWRRLAPESGGKRVVLVDRLVREEDEAEDGASGRTVPAFICAACGALHQESRERCDGCGLEGPLVPVLAVISGEDRAGQLVACLSCGARGRHRGGGWREPARPVRAVTVADVHVLAQNMIHRSERRRLLVFADNRQDAAFQAGWIRDHARGFRLRSLMMERIAQGALSVGDLVAWLDRRLEDDDDLSRALLTEVWNCVPKEAAGLEHQRERRWYLRVQVLRELATGVRQRLGLEPWGRIRIEYVGLSHDLPFIREWAERTGASAERLADGLAALIDGQRRASFLIRDHETGVFSRIWQDGDREVQRGYLPRLRGVPRGLKLARAAGDERNFVDQWMSERGDTRAKQAARTFGVPDDSVESFLEAFWKLLTQELSLLVPVTLKGSRDRALPGCNGVRQLDASRMLIAPHRGRWRCRRCRRNQVRPTPGDRCLTWRCDGILEWQPDDPENYDLIALDQGFAMLRAAEHSAQVPHETREWLEQQFKKLESERVNTLVCTPTLELGVDIGGLDSVLMRNVPPTPANYWQRVGRAGRRHRLAVNVTYARETNHDRQYFVAPLKLLDGRVEPPRFNLRNEVMLGRHVRAATVTRLRQLAREGVGLSGPDREDLASSLEQAFPQFVKTYLFEADETVRLSDYDLAALRGVIAKHEDDLVSTVARTFRDTWPTDDVEVVSDDRLRALVSGLPDALEGVIRRLRQRLQWCLDRFHELEDQRRRRGTLDEDQEALMRRCDRLVKRLKGVETRSRRETEGYDDRYTYAALAIEGFFPGYGLESGSIVATALMPRTAGGHGDFALSRPPVTALREYVPGNLIYANGGEFGARFYHFEAPEPLLFQVDVAHEAVREVGMAPAAAAPSLGHQMLKAVPICECDLTFRSHISDQEDHRFQLAVAILGEERDRHSGGTVYDWGGCELQLRHGQHLRMVNVGAESLVRDRRLGFPMSFSGSQCRSPFSSQAELDNFSKQMQERYGRPVEWCGFYADVVADALLLQRATSRGEVLSVLEAMRSGMAQVLEMEREDLEILLVAHAGEEAVDGFLYDPMPGGSGLLEQACARWPEVVEAALEIVEKCPGGCERSCIECLQTFRNAFHHDLIDRRVAIAKLREWGSVLTEAHAIPTRMPAESPRGRHAPVNDAETRLRELLLQGGLPEFRWQEPIDLGRPLGSTTPDAYFPCDGIEGLCVYLDGLSGRLHGNPQTAERDRVLREALRARGYEVIAVPVSDLEDRGAMTRHLRRIVRWVMGPEAARQVGEVE